MVFGKSYKEKFIKKQEKLKKLQDKTWFAWYPIKENYGRFIWLQRVKVDYAIYKPSGTNYLERSYKKPLYYLLKENQ